MAEPDFRSDRSESAEGKGRARRAWDLYASTIEKSVRPVLEPSAAVAARTVIGDLTGFWLLWHLYGGFEGLERYGYHRSTIFRKVKRFRQIFGVHPDEFELPGVQIDPKTYWETPGRKIGPGPSP